MKFCGRASVTTTGSSVKERLQPTTGSSERRQLQPTTDSSETATTVVPTELASARAVVYPNSKSVDPTIIIENNNRHFPVTSSDTTEVPGGLERGIQGATATTGVAGAEQQTRTGHWYNQISSSRVVPTFTALEEETSRKECSHFGESVIPCATVKGAGCLWKGG